MLYRYRNILMSGAAAGLLLLLTVSVLTPGTAQARVRMSDGGAHGYPGGGNEGDPLDSNDSGNGGGDIVHERREVPGGQRGGGLFDLLTSDSQITWTVEIVKGEPRLVLRIETSGVRALEAPHVR